MAYAHTEDDLRLQAWYLARKPDLIRKAKYLGWDEDDLRQQAILHLVQYPARSNVRPSTAITKTLDWVVSKGMENANRQKSTTFRTGYVDFDELQDRAVQDCDIDSQIDSWDAKEAIGNAMRFLSPGQRQVVELLFGLRDGIARDNRETGKILGITGERVRQIRIEALERLSADHLGLRAVLDGKRK